MVADIRAGELRATLDGVPLAIVAPVAMAAGLVPLVWRTGVRELVMVLALCVCIVCLVALVSSRRSMPRMACRAFVEQARHRAVLLSAALGLSCGAIPFVLLPVVDPSGRLLVFGAVVALGIAVILVGPILPLALVFLGPLLVGTCVGIARSGDPTGPALVAIAAALCGLVVAVLCRHRGLANRGIDDALRARDLDVTIDTLLLDFDEETSDWLFELDAGRCLRGVSAALASAAGRSIEALEGSRFVSLFSGAGAVRVAMADRKPFRNEVVEVATGATLAWWRVSGRPIHDAEGLFVGYRGIGADITATRATEARINYLANFDSLTGLANREQFQIRALGDCEAAAADGHWRALLYIDLDGFKTVNDGFGHAAGDDVLREVARRFRGCVADDAIVARLGGDEFAVWLTAATPTKAQAVAAAIIEAVAAPFDVQGTSVSIGASIGIAFTPKHGTDPDTLLGRADLALYGAKAGGKGHYRVFVEDYEWSLVERRKLQGDLKLALARGEFELHYQPIVDLSSGHVASFEALIRWSSPTRGLVSPVDFIPAAETSGLIAAIGRWVLFRACKDAASWPDTIGIAVNVSPRQVRAPDFVQTVLVALKGSGLAPARLELEVTEGVFLDDAPAARRNLAALRERGIKIALDDFGTGYSSLSYLVDIPVDTIKIDRSFVRDCATRPETQAIVEAILTIARKLSIHVTAEGVETKEQALALKLRRCDDVQGFLFGRPLPLADARRLVEIVPDRFREIFPLGFESPLGLALAMKQQSA